MRSDLSRLQVENNLDRAGEDPASQIDDEVKLLVGPVPKLERGDIREPFLVDAAHIERDFNWGLVLVHACDDVSRRSVDA